MGRAEADAAISIEVVRCTSADSVERVALRLPAGSTVADALRASGLVAEVGTVAPDVGVNGRRVAADRVLNDGDRVELYRPLRVDPMQARRLRAARQRG